MLLSAKDFDVIQFQLFDPDAASARAWSRPFTLQLSRQLSELAALDTGESARYKTEMRRLLRSNLSRKGAMVGGYVRGAVAALLTLTGCLNDTFGEPSLGLGPSSIPEAAQQTTDLPQLDAPENVIGPPGDAEYTDSGLASLVLTEGEGSRSPTASDVVWVHYTGWTTDGRRFDSSVARGAPTDFPVSAVISGWTEGLQLMVEGEKRRFWIPEELAYQGQRSPFGMLVFDVKLLVIVDD